MPQHDTPANPPRPAGDALDLPPARPELLGPIADDLLRWNCLRLIEELKDGELAKRFPEPPDEFADLAAEFAEAVVGGIAGDRRRAALAIARIEGRHVAIRLAADERQAWLNRWAALLRRLQLPGYARRGLWDWMAALTLRWLADGEAREPAPPLDLYRR